MVLSSSAIDVPDANLDGDLPEDILGLMILEGRTKKIWLKEDCPEINFVALHELSHYFISKAYGHKIIKNYDKKIMGYIEEVMADAGAIVLSGALGIKLNQSYLEQTKGLIKEIPIKRKKK